jgi:hypothetical protein
MSQPTERITSMNPQPQPKDPPLSMWIDSFLWSAFIIFILGNIGGIWLAPTAHVQLGCIGNIVGACAFILAFKPRGITPN